MGKHGKSLFRSDRFVVADGALVSDPQARRLRFEADGRVLFDASYDSLTALHYEASTYPPSRRRSRFYLTVHYTNGAGDPKAEVVRLTQGEADGVLAVLERDTGGHVERSPTKTSALGLPIHFAVNDAVVVTDDTGKKTKGRVARLSATDLDIGQVDGVFGQLLHCSGELFTGSLSRQRRQRLATVPIQRQRLGGLGLKLPREQRNDLFTPRFDWV